MQSNPVLDFLNTKFLPIYLLLSRSGIFLSNFFMFMMLGHCLTCLHCIESLAGPTPCTFHYTSWVGMLHRGGLFWTQSAMYAMLQLSTQSCPRYLSNPFVSVISQNSWFVNSFGYMRTEWRNKLKSVYALCPHYPSIMPTLHFKCFCFGCFPGTIYDWGLMIGKKVLINLAMYVMLHY